MVPCGGDPGDRRERRGVVGELVTRRVEGRGAVGGGHRESTVPVPAGEVTVRLVAVTPSIEVPGFVPKSTAVAPVKSVPVTVTEVPPPAGPSMGLTPVTVGSAGAL